MKINRMIPIVIALMLLSACTATTMNEAIEEDIPFNVKEIIHTEKVKDGVILLYLTGQENQQGEFDAVTVAFLKGNDQDGWENAGHNHWEHEKDEQMTVYDTVFYEYDPKGNLENKIAVIFGKIENEEINTVEVGRKKELAKARIIEKESGRYYFKIGDYEFARGIPKNKKKIHRLE